VKVAILHRGGRPLEAFDPDIVSLLVERTRRLGINIHVGHAVTRVERRAARFTVYTRSAIREGRFETDLVIHSAGRRPAFDDLDLAAGGIESENGRIKLDEQLRSVSNRAVFAAGDAAGYGPPLTPVAALDAQAVASNLLSADSGEGSFSPDYTGVPSVVFTTPPLARVGLSEEQARRQARDLRIRSEVTGQWFTTKHVGEPCAGFKTLVDAADDRILGAHLLGPQAQETVNLFALAMQNGISASELKRATLAFPTAGYDVRSML
jgi:glutathione reductase (NADPH)